MMVWTKQYVDGQLSDGRIPFVDCPGDELSPASVEHRITGWTALCGTCRGTCRLVDVLWLTPDEALGRGWQVTLAPTMLGTPPPRVN